MSALTRAPDLEEISGAARWREGAFDQALAAAVQRGVIDPLPGGFYRDASGPSDS